MTRSVQRLVLFDIDGTILDGGQVWKECFFEALSTRFPGIGLQGLTFGGKTDGQICMEVLELAGVGVDVEDRQGLARSVLQHYIRLVEDRALARASEVRLHSGVRELIEALREDERATVALLTGNLEIGAHLKLRCAGIDPTQFRMGVFADQHWNRYELPAIAIQKAEELLGLRFRGDELVIIGDTMHDVLCGRSVGARAIGVGTGRKSNREALLKAGPDFFFENLSATREVVEAIFA